MSASGSLVGPRRKLPVVPEACLRRGEDSIEALRARAPESANTTRELKARYAEVCRTYYTIAAVSRRAVLDETIRAKTLRVLFPLRTAIERCILADLRMSDRSEMLRASASKSFFGVSAKQGVSVRYALASCVPTRRCGGLCYAHDGRDRDINVLFRGVLNCFLGTMFEEGGRNERRSVLTLLNRPIDYAIAEATRDREEALDNGFARDPRIRFSHVGEMAATPMFTNALAGEIVRRSPGIRCVIYTRHPSARLLDSEVLLINFTLEGSDDTRGDWVPPGARVVSSAWDGQLNPDAEINFLEHHVERVALPVGAGSVCPVSADHDRTPSCDSAGCDLCFQPVTLRTEAAVAD